uniref:Uncharacterized protein n=1 Tax=Vespula pensylvanica TaxID=30213 RepID=A0A834N518_VESPE|nr:hypothetical protein H0235_016602 [Vespula pensylvanica]
MEPSIKHCFQAVNLQPIMKWRSGDILPLVTTIQATATGLVLLRISTSTHRSSRTSHSLEVVEKSQLTATGSVLLRISTSTHRDSHSTHSLENEMEEWGYSPTRDDNISDNYWFSLASNFDEMKLWSGDTGLRETTTKSNVRPILMVNGLVLLRISTSTHRSSRTSHSLEVVEKSQFALLSHILWGPLRHIASSLLRALTTTTE